jgi:hypothetical protein
VIGKVCGRNVALGLIGLLAIEGCGGDGRPSLVQVTGTVKVDGAPVEGAIVSLVPITDAKDAYKRPSAGVTDASGTFTMGTYEKTDGVPPGKYKVGIYKRELVGELPKNYDEEQPDRFNLKYKWVIPRKFSDPAASGLEAEVTNTELKPASFDLSTGGAKPEIEVTGPQKRRNEP